MSDIFEQLTLAEKKATTEEARIAIHTVKISEDMCRQSYVQWEKNHTEDAISYWWISAETFYHFAKVALKLVTEAGMESSILYTLQDARGVAFNEMAKIMKEVNQSSSSLRVRIEMPDEEVIQDDEDPTLVSE